MNKEIIIDKWVQIKPSFLTSSIREDMKDELSKQLVGSCDDINGRIIGITDVIDIIDNKIENSNSVVSILVKVKLSVYKPCVGDRGSCVVDSVYPEGVLGTLNECQHILIPLSSYSDTHSFSDDTLISGNKVVRSGDSINTRIVAVRFDNNGFRCLGVFD